MAISQEELERIKLDFYTGSDHEALKLPDEEKEDFWNWFKMNAIRCNIVKKESDTNLTASDNILGRCFGNSQEIALKTGKSYYEGFVKSKSNFIFHGYNYSSGKIEDYTVLSNPEEFKDINGNLPEEYYGIEIPSALIKEINSDLISNKVINIPHLIYKAFCLSKAK